MLSIGDMAHSLVMRHNQTKLREQIGGLGIELSTGVVKDKAFHLGGDLTALASLDRSLLALEGFRIATAETGYTAEVMQNSLLQMQDRIEEFVPRLLQAELIVSNTLRTSMSTDSAAILEASLQNLNATAGGRSVFGGVATDRPAVMDANVVLSSLRSELVGETTLTGIQARLDAWFDTPGGSYETYVYTGSSTNIAAVRLGENESASIDVRADDPVFRNLLKGLALAALSSDATLSFPDDLKLEILMSAGEQLLSAQTPLIEVRAKIGNLQARIEETETRNASEKTVTELMRLKLIGADQYESAVHLEEAQLQLEALYSVTARASRMSFVEFMR